MAQDKINAVANASLVVRCSAPLRHQDQALLPKRTSAACRYEVAESSSTTYESASAVRLCKQGKKKRYDEKWEWQETDYIRERLQ